jgi:calcineurin-like phosphoesterase family protein
MDEAMIANWNSVVKPDDEVYHLGDFAFSPAPRVKEIIFRLNGKKHLVWGNHDKVIQRDRSIQDLFVWCRQYYELSIPQPNSKHPLGIILFHYPILEWNAGHHGSINLHGHCHGNADYPWGKDGKFARAKILDVGVDVHDYKPISQEQVLEIVKSKPAIKHH